ncbi:MAG: BACON domain-containing protein, partial [Clostridia bacterium]|nr:BACON domain-containing protein [Clostridia bacterium]
MKRTLYILSVAALVLTGCTKENVETYYEEHAAQLEVSSQYVIFGADGGSKTVLVASSAEGWTWTADGSWYDVVQGNGSLEISTDANETGANRYSTLTVICGSLSETISVAQAMTSDDSTDLSADETANCYIASTGTSCRFNA